MQGGAGPKTRQAAPPLAPSRAWGGPILAPEALPAIGSGWRNSGRFWPKI